MQCLTSWFYFLPSFLFRTSYWSAATLSKINFSFSREPDSTILIHFGKPRSGIRSYQNLAVSDLRVMPL